MKTYNKVKQKKWERKVVSRFVKEARTYSSLYIPGDRSYEFTRFVLACRAFVKSYDG